MQTNELKTPDVAQLIQKKKRKKKKKKIIQKVDEQRIAQKAKISRIHKFQFTPQEKQRFALIQSHPLKLCISGVVQIIQMEQLKQFFNIVVNTTNPQLGNCIRSIYLDQSKSFGIMHVNNRRAKQHFRQNQDFTFGKYVLKVRKPKHFFQQRHREQKLKKQEQDHKVFMGGIPIYFDQSTVKAMCRTFGQLKYFNLITQKGVSKGYCFFQYQDPKNTDRAIKALNNLAVADRRLKVQKASSGAKTKTIQVSTRASNYAGSFLLSYQNYNNPDVQLTIRIPSYSEIPSRVLQLLNMCYPQDLFDDQFYYQLIQDVRQQAMKYGMVEDVVAPRPDPICGYAVPSIGKVFVKFMYIIPARRARQAISGKVYNKRTCIASFYPQQRFDLREYLIGY